MDYTVHGSLQARILGCVSFPFSGVSSQTRDRTQVSHIAGRFFTSWATREAPEELREVIKMIRAENKKTSHLQEEELILSLQGHPAGASWKDFYIDQ